MRVSIVIPVFNEEATIRDCLSCVVNQTVPVHECVIVDNNSTDRTLEVVKEFAQRLPLVIRSEDRQGVAWARQNGMSAASGDLLGQIDADSRLESDWVEAASKYMSANPDVSGANGPCYFYDSPFTPKARAAVRAASSKYGLRDVGRASGLTGGNSVVRREAWHTATRHLMNAPGTHEDVDLSYALKRSGADIRQLPAMIVSISTRRYRASLVSNWKYLRATIRTQRVHGDVRAAMFQTLVLPINLVQFSIAGVIFRSYDSDSGRWRLFGRQRRERTSPVTE